MMLLRDQRAELVTIRRLLEAEDREEEAEETLTPEERSAEAEQQRRPDADLQRLRELATAAATSSSKGVAKRSW